MCIYVDHGYNNRADYLQELSQIHNTTIEEVYAIADLLGEEEDFDGLVNACQDLGEDF